MPKDYGGKMIRTVLLVILAIFFTVQIERWIECLGEMKAVIEMQRVELDHHDAALREVTDMMTKWEIEK